MRNCNKVYGGAACSCCRKHRGGNQLEYWVTVVHDIAWHPLCIHSNIVVEYNSIIVKK